MENDLSNTNKESDLNYKNYKLNLFLLYCIRLLVILPSFYVSYFLLFKESLLSNIMIIVLIAYLILEAKITLKNLEYEKELAQTGESFILFKFIRDLSFGCLVGNGLGSIVFIISPDSILKMRRSGPLYFIGLHGILGVVFSTLIAKGFDYLVEPISKKIKIYKTKILTLNLYKTG